MNEGHSVSLNFYLLSKYKSLEEVKKRVVFTTHTPEMAGNEAHSYDLLKEMSFFYHLQAHEARSILGLEGDNFNYTLAALKFARKANGVSKLHGGVARRCGAAIRAFARSSPSPMRRIKPIGRIR